MSTADEYAKGRVKTIVGMAVGFTTMMRFFEKGSVRIIEGMVEEVLSKLPAIGDQREFDGLHDAFCDNFVKTIHSSRSQDGEYPSASYGQAAKVLDVALKACVDYCQLPDVATSKRLLPFLHAGIDTYILDELKKREKGAFKVWSLQEIDRDMYLRLQDAVIRHIEDEFNGEISRVVYDNIIWRRATKSDEPTDSTPRRA